MGLVLCTLAVAALGHGYRQDTEGLPVARRSEALSPGVARAAGALRDGRRIDVNGAPPEALRLLPGIGPALAERIVAERRRGGPFRSLQDLQRVRGIGPRKAARLAGWLRFGVVGEHSKGPPSASSVVPVVSAAGRAGGSSAR